MITWFSFSSIAWSFYVRSYHTDICGVVWPAATQKWSLNTETANGIKSNVYWQRGLVAQQFISRPSTTCCQITAIANVGYDQWLSILLLTRALKQWQRCNRYRDITHAHIYNQIREIMKVILLWDTQTYVWLLLSDFRSRLYLALISSNRCTALSLVSFSWNHDQCYMWSQNAAFKVDW